MSFIKWATDVYTRLNALKAFATAVGATPDEDRFVWSSGRYMILHFDLMTLSAGTNVGRDDVYDTVSGLVNESKGAHLGGSAYLVPLLPELSSLKCASLFWNALLVATAGKLLTGDSFFLHYAPDTKNLLGGIAQVVPNGKKSLERTKVPEH